VEAGDQITLVASGPERMSVSEIDALLYKPGRDQLERALRGRRRDRFVMAVAWLYQTVKEFKMRSDITRATVFPDYELSDYTGKHRKLSKLQGQDPMVVQLGRGGFCPKDCRQAEGLLQLHREMEVGYCRLVTISIDVITQTNDIAAE